MATKDLRGSLGDYYDIMPTVTVSFAASVSIQNATKERLASCVSVMQQHVQDYVVNVTNAVRSFINANTNATYPCLAVTYLSNQTCCDDTAGKCCPANHVYTKNGGWATSYCC